MSHQVRQGSLWATLALAFALFGFTFALSWGNFWAKISVSAAVLATLALWLQPDCARLIRFDRRSVLMGLWAAVGLYGIFWLGRAGATALFPKAAAQIADIYARGEDTPIWAITMLLLFVTGPCEELYWRGYLQRGLTERFGEWRGWLLGMAGYALVHTWTLNPMLIAAAAVAGAFWGLIFWRTGNLAPAIFSHSLWGVAIFALWPLG